MEEQLFRLEACGDLALLRRTLEDKGYTQAALTELLNPGGSAKPLEFGLDAAAAVCRTAAPSPLNTLVRLFILAQTVPEEAARQILAPADLDELVSVGLIHRCAEGVRAETALVPFADLLLARDFWATVTGAPDRPDYVPGVGPATLAVANLTVRRRAQSALDLGTGSGLHALLAAGHVSRVIATDVSPRALSMAALSVRLNGIDNVEFRRGSLYEPVEDCRFDLIVSNPPFVISPRTDYCYRDSGLPGDTISEQVIRGAARYLCEGGFATVLFNWHHAGDDDWAEKPRQWVESSSCDAWLLCSEHSDPISYASTWLRDSGAGDPQQYARRLDEWLAYYQRLGIRKISSGAIILRRRSAGPNWFRAERSPEGGGVGSCGEQILRIFAAQDLLEGLPDDQALLDKALVLTPDHELQYFMAAKNGIWDVQRAELHQTRGFAFAGAVDRLVSTTLVRCDGRRSLGEVISQVAADFRVDPEQTARSAAGVIRRLLHAGFLTAAGSQEERTP